MKRGLLGGLLLFAGACVQAETSIQTTVSNIQALPFSLTNTGPSQTLTFGVTSSDKLMVNIESGDTPIDVLVTDPSGTPLDAALIERYTIVAGEEPPLGAVLFSTGEHVAFTLDNPMPGEWRVELTLPVGSPDVLGSLTRITTGGLGVRLMTTKTSFREDQDIVLSALVFNGASPISGASVSAEVFTEDSVMAQEFPTILLADDGVAPDAQAGDGVYSAVLSGLTPGHYMAQAQITAGIDSAVGSTRFDVTSTLATFTGIVSDSGVDSNGDGLFDRIALQLGVAVIEAGDYAMIGALEINGKSVSAGTTLSLDLDSTSVEISFPADVIKTYLGEDGPYQIANVKLTQLAGTTDETDRLADRLVDLGQTQAYTLSGLQRPITLIPLGLADSATDLDDNGLYDRLTVTFTIDTLTASYYTWSGDVRSTDDQVLGVANSNGNLVAGANSVTLMFDGHDIGSSGVNGPYLIGNVAAYGNNGGANVADVLGETSLYFASQFEGGTPTFDLLIKGVSELVITGVGGVPRAEGIRTGLLQKLENAKRLYLENNRANAASNLVDAFVREVAAQSGKHIDSADANRLILLAEQLAASL
jgi:hypothetical protein